MYSERSLLVQFSIKMTPVEVCNLFKNSCPLKDKIAHKGCVANTTKHGLSFRTLPV